MRSWSFRQLVVVAGGGEDLPPTPMPPPEPAKSFPPPPRRVWRRALWGEVIALRLLLLPLLVGWGMLALAVGQDLALHLDGQEITGEVVNMRRDDRAKGPFYYVRYAFTADGGRVNVEQQVNESRYRKLSIGATVPVKTRIIQGERRQALSFSAWESANASHMGLLMLTLFCVLVFYGGWYDPFRTARLIRFGQIAHATVDKAELHAKNNQQTVRYSFVPAAGLKGARVRGATTGPNRPRAYVGQTVTIFYDPAKPKRNVAYEFCEFETDLLSR